MTKHRSSPLHQSSPLHRSSPPSHPPKPWLRGAMAPRGARRGDSSRPSRFYPGRDFIQYSTLIRFFNLDTIARRDFTQASIHPEYGLVIKIGTQMFHGAHSPPSFYLSVCRSVCLSVSVSVSLPLAVSSSRALRDWRSCMLAVCERAKWETLKVVKLRILVYLVMCDSGQVSLEHLLFSWYPSQAIVCL